MAFLFSSLKGPIFLLAFRFALAYAKKLLVSFFILHANFSSNFVLALLFSATDFLSLSLYTLCSNSSCLQFLYLFQAIFFAIRLHLTLLVTHLHLSLFLPFSLIK